ncbi:MAG: multiheme c-type cytochrome [Candidatus Latescibacterota bacterium]
MSADRGPDAPDLAARHLAVAGASLLLLAALLVATYREGARQRPNGPGEAVVAAESRGCVVCHRQDSPGLVADWEASVHARLGIGCVECHRAVSDDPAAWQHEGTWISSLVTPRDCGECHRQQAEEFGRSAHALAAGDAAAAAADGPGPSSPCGSCHGTTVAVARDGHGQPMLLGRESRPVLVDGTWPNAGIGRANPDGSRGACHACHARHSFAPAAARAPSTCGRCHAGPYRPELEVYEASRHGALFAASGSGAALEAPGPWLAGRHHPAAPTCATCHMGGAVDARGQGIPGTHDVGARLSWRLRAPLAFRRNGVLLEDGRRHEYPEGDALPAAAASGRTAPGTAGADGVWTWQERRAAMQQVCRACHGPAYVHSHYQRLDDDVIAQTPVYGRALVHRPEPPGPGTPPGATPGSGSVWPIPCQQPPGDHARIRQEAAMMSPVWAACARAGLPATLPR